MKEAMITKSSKLQARFKGGGTIVELPPVFSQDNQFVYAAWKNRIISYNTKTAKRICEFKDAKHPIVGFGCIYSSSDEYIAACTNNGKVILWKANTALKLRELKLNLGERVKVKYFKIILGNSNSKITQALVCTEHADTNMYEFNLLNLESGQLKRQHLKLKIDPENNRPMFIDVSKIGRYFVVVRGRSMYYNAFGSKRVKFSIKGRTLTCVACHPQEVAVLTGDNTGRVLLWHNIESKKNTSQAIFHWHTLPVEALCFSTSGSYFYSGAAECVLVKWDQHNNHSKNFLPRLPGAIKHITVAENNVLIAVATKDNGIQLISPQLNVMNTIQHLVLGHDNSGGVIYDSRSKSLILNGIAGHVQLFSPKDMNLMYSLDVVGQNKLTNERNKDIISTVVSKVAINNSGSWMATIEYRPDPEMVECRLKFWYYNATKQNFCLNTSIEYPHEDKILDVVFQPTGNDFELLCITVGRDKKFKVWKLVEVFTVYYQGYSWKCSGEATYKDLNLQAATFSNDGSLIVVGFESIITIWLSSDYKLKFSLRHPLQCDDIIHLSFGNRSECHLLFCATSKYISVWNILSLSLTWTVRVDVSLAISDVLTPFKALFTKDKKLFVVDLKSSKPIYSSKKILKHVGEIQAAAFVPKNFIGSDINQVWYKTSCIYFLDSNYDAPRKWRFSIVALSFILDLIKKLFHSEGCIAQKYFRLYRVFRKQELYSIETLDESQNTELYTSETNTSLYSHLVPKISTNIQRTSTTHMYEKGNSTDQFRKFLDTPVTSLPPLHLLCEGILQSMILQRADCELEGRKNNEIVTQDDKIQENEDGKDIDKFCDLLKTEKQLSRISKESTDWVSILLEN